MPYYSLENAHLHPKPKDPEKDSDYIDRLQKEYIRHRGYSRLFEGLGKKKLEKKG